MVVLDLVVVEKANPIVVEVPTSNNITTNKNNIDGCLLVVIVLRLIASIIIKSFDIYHQVENTYFVLGV